MGSVKKLDQGKIAALRSQGTLNPSARRVSDPLFQNKEFFDPCDLVQVKYELLRRVQIEGMSVTKAAKSFGVSRLSFYRISAVFEKFGLIGFIPQKRGPRHAHKVTTQILKFIDEQIKNTSSINSRELKKAIEKKFQLSVHPRSIERALSQRKKKRTF